jgi:hypothetical protein
LSFSTCAAYLDHLVEIATPCANDQESQAGGRPCANGLWKLGWVITEQGSVVARLKEQHQ